MNSTRWLILSAACLLAIVFRLAPVILPGTPAGLDCLIAFALLSGAGLRSRWAVVIPLAARLLTDLVIHWRTGDGFWPSMAFDYAAYLAIAVLAREIAPRRWPTVVAGGLLSPLLFFIISNLGVWWLWSGTYPFTLAGLMECYAAGLPFQRVTLVSNFAFCLVFFAIWNAATAEAVEPSTEPAGI